MKKLRLQQILPAISCLGVVATAVFASKAGVKAEKVLEEHNYIHHPNPCKDIFEQSKIVWKEYILTGLVVSATIGSIIATKKLTKKEMAALGLLATSSTKLLGDYRNILREKYGNDEIIDIEKRIAAKRVHRFDNVQVCTPPPEIMEGIGEIQIDKPHPGDDEVLFYDDVFNMEFRSSIACVRTAMYLLNRNFNMRQEVSLEEFYEFLGVPNIPDEFASLGWGDDFREGGITWIDFSITRSDLEDGEPYYILSYLYAPEYLYPF